MNTIGQRASVPKAKANAGIPTQLEQRHPFSGLPAKLVGSLLLRGFVLGECVAVDLMIDCLVKRFAVFIQFEGLITQDSIR